MPDIRLNRSVSVRWRVNNVSLILCGKRTHHWINVVLVRARRRIKCRLRNDAGLLGRLNSARVCHYNCMLLALSATALDSANNDYCHSSGRS